MKIAQLIKVMIDTPILDDAGALVLSTEKTVADVDAAMVVMKGEEPAKAA